MSGARGEPTDEPTAIERAAVDTVVGPPTSTWDGGERNAADLATAAGGLAVDRGRRHLLLAGIHALQDRVGWVSRGGLAYLGGRLGVAPAEAYGVASFYSLFSLEPAPVRTTLVCTDVVCMVASGGAVAVPADGAHRASNCLGLCERAPAALVMEAGESPRATPVAPHPGSPAGGGGASHQVPVPKAVPQAGDPSLVLLCRVGSVDPGSLDAYRAAGGYVALRRALELGPAGVIAEVAAAGLLGRGGAAFPTGRKWQAVASQPARPHYLVANADESEPGTFKDRVLLEGDPFAVVEAMTIAGLATGCERGYLYLRGEYPVARAAVEAALAAARAHHLLGPDVWGSGFAFDIEVVRGAGAYVCGEETAIFNSIEGFRGEPRNKPPYPTEVGLFGCPTLVNNVETLLNVLPILARGSDAFAAVGTARSTGTKLFAVSGSVTRPGAYEVPFGTTLGDVIERAGGVAAGTNLRTVLLGGAAGSFVGPDQLDLPLTFEHTAAAGATLGSGAVMVIDDTVDIEALVLRIAAFFRDESCGQCVPCRVGTVRQEEALIRLEQRPSAGAAAELALLSDVGRVMRDASICGLGQTAPVAVASAIERLGAFGGSGR